MCRDPFKKLTHKNNRSALGFFSPLIINARPHPMKTVIESRGTAEFDRCVVKSNAPNVHRSLITLSREPGAPLALLPPQPAPECNPDVFTEELGQRLCDVARTFGDATALKEMKCTF